MHHFGTYDDEYSQCFRCGGLWSDARIQDANYCVATKTDFQTVHGIQYEDHDTGCFEFAENETCKHVEHDCNCDLCEFCG